ncbi:MAG: nuclear transport factor 2 family protein [Actinobacteria bacterium]|nr:nuclear transport factor 2 family protein [Actinomycetota bacterium]
MTGQELLAEHVSRFNAAIRSSNFETLLELFADDAELAFEGVPAGPFSGRAAIAAAYREHPPDDEIRVLAVTEDNSRLVADYAWLATPDVRAGEMLIDHGGTCIRRLVVTFE